MKKQKYSSNVDLWQNILGDFNWDILFSDVDSRDYEFQIDQYAVGAKDMVSNTARIFFKAAETCTPIISPDKSTRRFSDSIIFL